MIASTLLAPVLLAATLSAPVPQGCPPPATAPTATPPAAPTGTPAPTPEPVGGGGGGDGSAPSGPRVSIEDEVLGNVLAQPAGAAATVADLAYSEAYLRRVSDRVVRATFEMRWRRVLPDAVIEEARRTHATSTTAATAPVPAHVDPPAPSTSRNWILAGVVVLVLAGFYGLSRRGAKTVPEEPAANPSRRKGGRS